MTRHKNTRTNFINKLGENEAVAIIPAHPETIRNHDVHFKFRQDSNFFFLTGFEEPDSIAVFRNVKGQKEYVLFVRPKDLTQEIWTGPRAGPEDAVSIHGANRAYPISEFEKILPELLKDSQRVYYGFRKTLNINGAEYLDSKMIRLLDEYRASLGRTGKGILPIYDTREILGEMRIHKTDEEVSCLKKAAAISAHAHTEVMARTKPGLYEYQIEALLEFIFMNEGCARHGYPCIVASGSNATVLHYVENNKMLKDGDLLLIDAGGEYGYYPADITRTFPVNGEFTKEQLEIYEIVLQIQKECIQMAKPGATLAQIHNFVVAELTHAMVGLKFISELKKYYPHNTSHFLGSDVHDMGLYQMNGEPRKLEPGMCFTVEPGFYILQNDMTVPEKYRGIGVRIEDDLLITNDCCDVLTKDVTKDADEMCRIIGTKKWISLN